MDELNHQVGNWLRLRNRACADYAHDMSTGNYISAHDSAEWAFNCQFRIDEVLDQYLDERAQQQALWDMAPA